MPSDNGAIRNSEGSRRLFLTGAFQNFNSLSATKQRTQKRILRLSAKGVVWPVFYAM